MEFFSLIGEWDTYVDDVYYPSPYNPPYVINTEFEGILQCESDGFADFYNLDSVPHRIMFVPIIDGNASYMLRPENQNQSFLELDDGSIVFCLAPAAEQCVPDSVLILPNANEREVDTATVYSVTYELDDGISVSSDTGTFTTESTYSSGLASYGDLLYSLAVAIGLSFHGGGGGTTAWSIGYRQMGNHGIIGGDGSGSPEGKVPQTLKLSLTPSAANDAVQVLFGDGITVHSCGSQYFDGI